MEYLFWPGAHLQRLVHFASHKLRWVKDGECDELNSLAGLSCRFALEINPTDAVTLKLVADSMAQLDYLSVDGSQAFVSFPSDFTLSEGAKSIIKASPSKCLQSLLTLWERSVVSIGIVGDFVAQVIACSAFDKASAAFPLLSSITFSSFLQAMFGTARQIPDSNARMFFNHFVPLEKSMNP